MRNSRIQQAIAKLPQSVHVTAASLEENHGKRVAADYLKTQIMAIDPTIKFKVGLAEPEKQIKVERSRIYGTRSTCRIIGCSVPSIRAEDGKRYVSRVLFARALGWHDKLLTGIPEASPKARRLKAAGYSFQEFMGSYRGCRKPQVCITIEDARIAAGVFGIGERQNAA